MKTTQRNAGTARDARTKTEEGWGVSVLVLVSLDIAVLAAAVWLALSVPETFDRAAAEAQVAGMVLTDEGPTIYERYQVNATEPSFAVPVF